MRHALLILILAALYAILFGFLMRSLYSHPHKRHYTRQKTFVSIGFVGVAAASAAYSGAWLLLWQLVPALVLYLAGDVLLGIYNRKRDMRLFFAGSGSFLFGHIAFAAALGLRIPLYWWDFLWPTAVLIGAAVVMAKVRPAHMPRSFWPAVPAYSFFVALSAGLGLHAALVRCNTAGWLLAVGTALFLASDCIIPAVYFSPKKSLRVHAANLATYYGGMFCIALSLSFPW